MIFPSKTIEEAVNELSRFPGIGKKTAIRMAIHLLKGDERNVEKLASAIVNLRKNTLFCSVCGNISEAETCAICTSVNRKKAIICVVKDFQDIIAIENTGQYNGVYHVLNGLISPIEGIGPDDIRIAALLDRIAALEDPELIFALSANMEGDTTAFYISRKLGDSGIKITALSRGIAVGGELEFADEITLGRSIRNRTPYLIRS